MPQAFNYERAAAALVDAMMMGDRAAADKYDISVKSLERWRKRLSTDEVLRGFVSKYKVRQDSEWAASIPATMTAAIGFINRAANEGSVNASMLESMAKALETLSDVALTWKVMDERLSEGRSETEEAG